MAIRILKSKTNGKETNGKAVPPEAPAQPSAADLDAVAAEEQAKEATAAQPEASPLSTPLAEPAAVEQTSAPGSAPESLPTLGSFLPPNENVNWTDPKLDTTKKDSLGNLKTDDYVSGPKGESLPADVQTPAQLQAAADAREARLSKNMASTVKVDSLGQQKGRFAVRAQGHDAHGMRLPDQVDRSQVVEAPAAHVGPRGKGAPTDSFHGPRQVKK